ncbi:hypothetical protein VTJ04DRAFT_10879 [Mycothermus thermophilus]|uniref:uncharacterized protein n=1 Tax=Humicola insolens TaxID=85995 RepID=UPI003743C897
MKATAVLATLALAASPALAYPKHLEPHAARDTSPVLDITPRAAINEAEVFPWLTPDASCKILDCVSVIGSAVCIIDAIGDDDWRAICGCAGCISGLNRFLEKWGICD